MHLTNLPTPAQAKADFLNAIRLGPPGRVPYFEFAFSRPHLASLLGPQVITDYPRGPIPAGRTPPQWSADVALKLGIGFIMTGFIWELGRVYEDDGAGNTVYAGGSLRTAADLKAAPEPDLEPTLARLDQFIALARRHDLAVGFSVYGPMSIAHYAMGLEHYCLSIYDDLGAIHAVMDAATRIYVPLIEHAVKRGVDFLLFSETLAFKSGTLLPPEVTRALLRRGTPDYLKPARDHGVPIGMHSDGDNTMLLDDFIDLGIQFLHPIEPCDGAFDIYKTQARVAGKLALVGNIDLTGVLSYGSPAQVRADVIDHIHRLAPQGGYLCGSSHEIPDSVSPQNFQALVQAVHDHANSWPPSAAPR